MAEKKYKCPKCQERYMTLNSKTPGGKQRWWCREGSGDRAVCYQTTDPTKPYRDQAGRTRKADERPQFKRALGGLRRCVVTWAQNATPVHKGFFATLRNFCERNDAELIVIPGRYKNPTSQWTQAQENAETWAEELTPYLYNGRKKLNNNLVLLGDIKTQPTRVAPLSGYEALTHGESAIVGHPKLQLATVATPQSRMPKIMTTTGAVTVANYTDTSAGKKGEFHHVLGAALVEIENSRIFHLRQINARKDGAFVDLDTAYFPDGSAEACGPYLGLVLGDSHVRFRDRGVERATFGPGGLVELLNPGTLVFHDLLDAYAVNPHHVGDPFVAVAKQAVGFHDIRREVVEAIDWLRDVSKGRSAVVVPSNHDDMLKRWLVREDWRKDPRNAEFYLETALHMVRSTVMTAQGSSTVDPFGHWLERMAPKNVRALRRGESFTIGGIECNLHGDSGPNGARGSVKNLSKIGVKVISGHGHSPAIEGGHYRVGTSTPLALEYTGPVGSWLNTHCSIDPFGKRHLHTIIDGRFRA